MTLEDFVSNKNDDWMIESYSSFFFFLVFFAADAPPEGEAARFLPAMLTCSDCSFSKLRGCVEREEESGEWQKLCCLYTHGNAH